MFFQLFTQTNGWHIVSVSDMSWPGKRNCFNQAEKISEKERHYISEIFYLKYPLVLLKFLCPFNLTFSIMAVYGLEWSQIYKGLARYQVNMAKQGFPVQFRNKENNLSCLTDPVSNVTCHMSRVTCHVSHVTCHMSRVTCHVFLSLFFSFFL